MAGFLLDTNVISEFDQQRGPNPQVLRWLNGINENLLFVSVLTLGEIRFGVERLPTGKRRTQLKNWLERDLQEWFDGQILPVDQWIADRWGSLRAEAQKVGRTLSAVDCLLAATAERHGLTIVSRNEADFAAAGLNALNPWKS